ncbi:MAG TPA: hypothetical protein VNO21_09280 [Polyangiaceae bacterium]|nr:hypothetical protein [Polyangiaceae bacterium]
MRAGLLSFLVFLVLPLVPSALSIAACSSSSDTNTYDTLFETPSNGNNTANDVHGLWASSIPRDPPSGNPADMAIRMLVSDSQLLLANRCTFADGTELTAGVTVGIQLNLQAMNLVTTTSAEDYPTAGDDVCSLTVGAGTLAYVISEGRTLTFQGHDLPYPTFGMAKYSPAYSKESDD